MKAKNRNSIASMSVDERHRESSDEKVEQRNREHELPGKRHQLVIAEARERTANPDKDEQQRADLSSEPEQRQNVRLKKRQCEEQSDADKDNSRDGQRNSIERPRRVQSVIQRN